MTHNIRNLNYDGYVFSFDTQRYVPVLSNTTRYTLERINTLGQINIPLPPSELDTNLNHKIDLLPPKPLSYTEDLSEYSSRHSRLTKLLINTTLEAIIITSILVSLAFPPCAPGLVVLAMFLGSGLCVYNAHLTTSDTLEDIRIQNEQLKGFQSGLPQQEDSIVSLVGILLWLAHLIPFTPFIELLFHKYRYKQINQIQEQSIARDFVLLFKYYDNYFHQMNEKLTQLIANENNSDRTKSLEKARKELSHSHAFYMRMFEPMRKPIIENCVSASLPKDLGSIIAEFYIPHSAPSSAG